MKYTILILFFTSISFGVVAQNNLYTTVKNNYVSFTKDSFYKHPDIYRFNSKNHLLNSDFAKIVSYTPCNECVEIYDKRDAYNRYYIKTGSNAQHFFKQSSKIPLNYLNENNQYESIEYRLRNYNDSFYAAIHQPVKTFINKFTKEVALKSGTASIQFGTNTKIYFSDEANSFKSNYSTASYTVGDDGMFINNAYENINLVYQFKKGSIQTNYIIKEKPAIHNTDFLIIKEEIHLGELAAVIPNDDHYIDNQGNYFGALDVLNSNHEKVFKIEKAVMYDANFVVYPCYYEYELSNHILILYTKVPMAYINAPTTQYPITIDPWVTGYNKVGNFNSTGLPSAGMQFTYNVIGSCDYFLNVTVPGECTIINTYVDVEDENELSVSCGTPPLPAPGCRKHDIRHFFSSIECGTSTSLAAPPLPAGAVDTPGTVTTDPLVIPGARSILIPGMLDCIVPQCPDYLLHFKLENEELRCGETCGNKCATGNMWAVTIEGRRLEGRITLNRDLICAGEPLILSAIPTWGVPPYHYRWSNGDTTQTIILHPTTSGFIDVQMFDLCDSVVRKDTSYTVVPSPPADAGVDKYLCEGGSISIGGDPTTSIDASVIWQAIPAGAVSYMSGTLAYNPVISIPAGVLGEYIYIVKATDFSCFRYDTVRVFSIPNPIPTIIPDTNISICEGASINLSTTEPYDSYAWSNGTNTRINTVSNAGNYFVNVTDSNNCIGTSNSITISLRPLLNITAYPDTLIDPEETVTLYSNPSMTNAIIDSFYWVPNTFIPCTNCPNPISIPEEDITYTLYVLSDGCWSSDSVTIRLKYPFDFFMPNAFTPNGDGFNDQFLFIRIKSIDSR